MNKAVLQAKDNYVAIKGDLTFDSVPDLWQDARALLTSKVLASQVVDLAEVGRADSAGVALLVAWLGLVRKRGHSVQFINPPEQMRVLVQITGLAALLSLDAVGTNPL